jgi:transcriptional regulator with XRE-family HTH domain
MASDVSIDPSLSMLETYVKHAEALFKYPKQMETLGDRMKKARLDQGLTLEVVAEAIGISVSALSQIENGQTKSPKPQHFVKWCAFFGANQNRMLFDDPDPPELRRLRGQAAILGNRPKSRSRE